MNKYGKINTATPRLRVLGVDRPTGHHGGADTTRLVDTVRKVLLKRENVYFKFYLWLYGVGHVAKDS